MDLHEIRNVVAKFLELPQLSVAVIVCKSWHATFNPHLYSQILWYNFKPRPAIEILRRNAKYIRAIIAYSEPPPELPLDIFVHLEILSIGFGTGNSDTWRRISDVISRGSKIAEVNVDMSRWRQQLGFIGTIVSCPSIKRLGLSSGSLSSTTSELLLDACVHLERLTLKDVKLTLPKQLDQWSRFPTMRALHLKMSPGMSIHQQLQLIGKCPGLIALYWETNVGETFPVLGFCDTLVANCPHLSDLTLLRHESEGVAMCGQLLDRDLATFIDSCTGLRSLCVMKSRFSPCSFLSCSRHFDTLTRLNIKGCREATSAMSQIILTSCPRLIEYHADFLEARDIIGITDGEGDETRSSSSSSSVLYQPDWVCMNLRDLSIFLCGLEGKPKEWQFRIMIQLARLKNLKYLNISPHDRFVNHSRDGLDLRLESGLDLLKDLGQLKVLDFNRLWQEMTEEEVYWIMKSWPNLARIYGGIHYQRDQRFELESLFDNSHIQIG